MKERGGIRYGKEEDNRAGTLNRIWMLTLLEFYQKGSLTM